MQARINEKHDVAKGTLFVTFDLLGEQVDFKPGQYFFVTLPDAGHQDDRGLRRHFSVVTSPNDKVLGLATRMRDSAFKRTLRELPIGTEVDVEQPKGDFVLPEDTSRPLVFIAGGIGITVFRSMLRYIREEALPLSSDARLLEPRPRLHGVPRRAPRARAGDLRLPAHPHHDPGSGWDGETRKVDTQFVEDYLGENLDQSTFLVAGPPPLVEGAQKALEAAAVPEENVIAESYSGY